MGEMDQRNIDLLICVLVESRMEAPILQRMQEKFPALRINAANGMIKTWIALGARNYNNVLFVTTGRFAGSTHGQVEKLRRSGFRPSGIFMNVIETAEEAGKRRRYGEEFASEVELLAALDAALAAIPLDDA
jgi:hypothetical protein